MENPLTADQEDAFNQLIPVFWSDLKWQESAANTAHPEDATLPLEKRVAIIYNYIEAEGVSATSRALHKLWCELGDNRVRYELVSRLEAVQRCG
jgi:hypothetical protein